MKNKTLAFIILIMAVFSEYFHWIFEQLFGKVVHSYYLRNGEETAIYWDDMIYYLFNELFVFLLTIIFLVKIGTTRASKAIMTGIVFWFMIEFIEITLQFCKISDARLFINDGSWLQLSTCLTVSLLVLFGNKKLS